MELAYPGIPSPDFELSWSRLPRFTEELKSRFGVTMADSAEQVAERSDAQMILSTDARGRLEAFEQVAPYRKPVYINKPFALGNRDAQEIVAVAARYRVPFMSCSALRFADPLIAELRREENDIVKGADCHGPMPVEETQEGLFWYGIHTVEMLYAIMGTGCLSVSATSDEEGDVIVGTWKDGRCGVVRGNRTGNEMYGALVHRGKSTRYVDIQSHPKPVYAGMLESFIRMCETGESGITAGETLEIIRFLGKGGTKMTNRMDTETLALLGGPKAVTADPGDLFTWPIITREDEEAALDVLRRGTMSGTDVTQRFEEDFRNWTGMDYALGFNNGTSALQAAMYGCGIGIGDEVICPSVTYWASCLSAYSLGATVVFADIDPVTVCIDPNDIEHRIGPRTKAIMVVHYFGYPADMDPIMALADKYKLKVIEDVSHAHGGIYKGRMLGTIGHVGAMSLMAGKSLAVGEAGMLVTPDRDIYERAVALGHYERFDGAIQNEELSPYRGLPMGGYKFRMHQVSSAVGRVQLRHYPQRNEEIGRAMNHFWDLLEGTPGIGAHRPVRHSGSFMGGWYAARGHYKPEELGGLSVTQFCAAVRAEGVAECSPGCNLPLHLHPLLQSADVFHHGKPTRIANAGRDVRELDVRLPVSEGIAARLFSIPWFKHYRPQEIEQHADAFRKAADHYRELLATDPGNPPAVGGWSMFSRR